MENLFVNYYEAVSMILFGIGFTTLLLQKNMIKKVIGINIMDTAIYLFLAAKGYIAGRADPIIMNGMTNVEAYINPIPSGLVLTGIVVSVSVSAFFLALIHQLYKAYGTLDIDEVIERAKKQEGKNDQLYS
ncbi:MAG: cation:proton antiporter subunit C [Clostridium sp.]